MRAGVVPQAALQRLLEEDGGFDGGSIGERQVGLVDARGRAAVYTGEAAAASPRLRRGECVGKSGISDRPGRMDRCGTSNVLERRRDVAWDSGLLDVSFTINGGRVLTYSGVISSSKCYMRRYASEATCLCHALGGL